MNTTWQESQYLVYLAERFAILRVTRLQDILYCGVFGKRNILKGVGGAKGEYLIILEENKSGNCACQLFYTVPTCLK